MTGASGFVGSAVVRAAHSADYSVLALVRRPTEILPEPFPDGVEVVEGDLQQAGDWCHALASAQAVIHGAVNFGSLEATMCATENLLAALPAQVSRFVLVSSMTVYDFAAPGRHGTLDEATPLEPDPLRRDIYTLIKLRQEELVRAHCRERGIPLVIARPVAVYGAGHDWGFGRAARLGWFDFMFAPFSTFRLIHVYDCASALVAALSAPIPGPDEAQINLIGDDVCGYWSLHHQARRLGANVGIGIPVPYVLIRALGWAAALANTLIFTGRKKLPKKLDPVHQIVFWQPMRYSNRAAKQLLSWTPQVSLRAGIEELIASQPRK